MTRLRTRYTQRLPTAPGLRLDVPFFEGSGEIAHDLSGKDNHGTLHNVTWTSLEQGPVGSFNGSSSYSDHGNKHWLNIPDAFTIEMQVNMDVSNSFAFTSTVDEFFLVNNNAFRISLKDLSTGGRLQEYFGLPTAYEGSMTQFVVTYDGSGSVVGIKAYWDSVEKTGDDESSGTFVAVEDTENPSLIGNIETKYADGAIGKSRRYARVLSANTIQRRYEQPWYDYCRGG